MPCTSEFPPTSSDRNRCEYAHNLVRNGRIVRTGNHISQTNAADREDTRPTSPAELTNLPSLPTYRAPMEPAQLRPVRIHEFPRQASPGGCRRIALWMAAASSREDGASYGGRLHRI